MALMLVWFCLFGRSTLDTSSGPVTPHRALHIAFKSDKAKGPLFPCMISSVLILLSCPAQRRKMIRAASCLQSWILCYFFPSLRHNRLGLFFHAGGPQTSVKGERHIEPEGRHGQMYANLGNGVVFRGLLGLAIPSKDSVN